MKVPESFYEKLAYLFYAIADADGRVNEKELGKLHEEIIGIWKSLDNSVDEFNTNLAFEIEAIFEWLDDNKYSYKDAFKEFKDYATEHKKLFSTEVKEKIMHTSSHIADSFRHINHPEEHILHELKFFLEHL
jgi:regulator of replication initiation timing